MAEYCVLKDTYVISWFDLKDPLPTQWFDLKHTLDWKGSSYAKYEVYFLGKL